MDLKEIKSNEFFTIGETPSYPKFRIDDGYIDIRDGIMKRVKELHFPLRKMDELEVLKQLDCDKKNLDEHLKPLRKMYISFK